MGISCVFWKYAFFGMIIASVNLTKIYAENQIQTKTKLLFVHGGDLFFDFKPTKKFLFSYSIAKKNELIVWQTPEQFIYFKNSYSKQNFLKINKNNSLFSIEFDLGSDFYYNLYKNNNTKIIYKDFVHQTGKAFVIIKDPQQLETLAQKAHSGAWNMCGKIVKLSTNKFFAKQSMPIAPIYEETMRLKRVVTLQSKITAQDIVEFVHKLGTFPNRGSSTPEGAQVPQFIIEQAKQLNGQHNKIEYHRYPIDQSTRENYGIRQDNLVIKVKGEDSRDKNIVIVGAHMDTIAWGRRDTSNQGSDDDASGIATWFVVLKTILSNKARFKRTIEFHGYAAEEIGLIGSEDLAKKYRNSQKKVAAMLQLDMNMYSKKPNDTTIYFVKNHTSKVLRRSLKNLLNTYLGGNFKESYLTAGTSDHRSWYFFNYPSVFPFEDPRNYNPHIHTPQDNPNNAPNKKLALRFSKLVLAFLSHHAGLISTEGHNYLDL